MRCTFRSFRTNLLPLDSLSPIWFTSWLRSSVCFSRGCSVDISLYVRMSIHNCSLSVLVMNCMKCFIIFRQHSPIEPIVTKNLPCSWISVWRSFNNIWLHCVSWLLCKCLSDNVSHLRQVTLIARDRRIFIGRRRLKVKVSYLISHIIICSSVHMLITPSEKLSFFNGISSIVTLNVKLVLGLKHLKYDV